MKHKFVNEDKAGNREALIENTIRKHADMIYRIAYQNTGSYDDAEDILQEVSIALVTKNAPFENEEHLKRWLIRVTINKCRDLHRHLKVIETEPLEDHEDIPADEKGEIMEELQQLPEQYRNIIYLYYYEQYTLQEIADIMKKSINTISSGLQRARNQLKRVLMEEGYSYG